MDNNIRLLVDVSLEKEGGTIVCFINNVDHPERSCSYGPYRGSPEEVLRYLTKVIVQYEPTAVIFDVPDEFKRMVKYFRTLFPEKPLYSLRPI